jgi:hypothetical protein
VKLKIPKQFDFVKNLNYIVTYNPGSNKLTEDLEYINHSCVVNVSSNKYSIPYTYFGKHVLIRIMQGDKPKASFQQTELNSVSRLMFTLENLLFEG